MIGRRTPSSPSRAWPAALVAASLLWLVGHLLVPGRLLVARDVTNFHLPLRSAAATLAERHGLPQWNPWINGGQPLLSNPNYAWFYPPTWLAATLPAPQALGLLVVLHAGIAAAGAWALLQRLGAGREAAALGSLGFAGSTWFLSLAHSYTSICGNAWLPWVLLAGHSLLQADSPRGRLLPTLGCSLALALQLLAGEPMVALIGALGLGCLVLSPGRGLPSRIGLLSRVGRLALVGLLAALFAAVQLLPTAARLHGSERAEGVAQQVADTWSSSPARWVDVVLPRFWGDAMHDEQGRWFGWAIHDRSFPYVIGLYSGLLLVVLAAAALTSWPVPHRTTWLLALLVGVLLGLGRHNPAWGWLRESVPLLGLVRFPEKFVVLAAAVVPLAGALGWHHLTVAAARGEHRKGIFPLALACIVWAVVAVVVIALAAHPALATDFVRSHGRLLTATTLAEGVAFVKLEARVALLLASGVVLVLAGVVFLRRGRHLLAPAALLLLATDLGWYGRDLLPTLPVEQVLALPPLAAEVKATGGRLYASAAPTGEPEIHLRNGPGGFHQLWASLQGLEPYVGNLFGIEYALNDDFDLMLTRWGRHARSLLPPRARWTRLAPSEPELRLAGAWDVRTLVYPRRPSEVLAEVARTRQSARETRSFPNPFALPRFRFAQWVGRVEDMATARHAVRRLGYRFGERELCVGEGGPPAGRYAPAELLASTDQGQVVRLRYRAASPAFLVAAITYDEGWSARLEDGSPVSLCPTALGQIGALLPPGEHLVRLSYRDHRVPVGAGVTLLSLLIAGWLALRARRPEARARRESTPGGRPG